MAKYIGYITDKTYDDSIRKQEYGARAPYLRRVFDVVKPIKRAVLYASAYGIFEVYVNGKRVSDEVYAAGWSDYHYKVYYRSYNVTEFIRQGKNALGAILGDGWYASNLSDVGRFVFGGYPLKFRYEIELLYEDGERERITINGQEKGGVGAILQNDNQNGIVIDEREDCGDFSSPDYDDSKWQPVTVYEGLKPHKASFEPIRPHTPLSGKVIVENQDSIVFDFGQNFAGVLRAKFKGKSGDTIVFKYGELMDGDHVYVENLRTALATDTFILSGTGSGEFYPTFTYHGFRYAEIFIPKGVEIISIEGVPLYSDLKETGKFICSNEQINKLYNNVFWAQKSNFFSVPTDCPQRDERLGWIGDAQLFFDMASYNMDCNAFYAKYLDDIEDSMKDGKPDIPVVLPYLFDYVPYDKLHVGYPGWSDGVIIMPYCHYLKYGSRSVLIEHLPLMKQHVKYMLNFSNDFVISAPNCHGDWLSVYEVTDKDVYSTLYFGYAVNLLAKICRILGDSDEDYYVDLFMRVKKAFKDKFVNEETGVIKSDTECSYILAYAFEMLSAKDVKKHLIRKFNEYGNKLVAGFHGAKFALDVLAKVGLKDLAYTLLLNDEYPSWGYSIKNGATTIWERWDGVKDGGKHKDAMNSFNHFVFGSAIYWLYEGVLGISPTEDGAGFKKIKVRPYFDERIQSASGSYESVSGLISVEFKYTQNGIEYVIKLCNEITPVFDFENAIISQEKTADEQYATYKFILQK